MVPKVIPYGFIAELGLDYGNSGVLLNGEKGETQGGLGALWSLTDKSPYSQPHEFYVELFL